MSRGGRGPGRGRGGGRRTGPDVAWDDEPVVPQSTKPEPLFPDIDFPIPKPLTDDEIERVEHYLDFRDEVRNGPYYAVLEPSSFTDDKGKTNPRAGFDPFTNVERYSSKFYKPKRTTPDLSRQNYELSFFPRELWSVLDPEKKNPAWKTLPPTTKRTRPNPKAAIKRKAPIVEESDSEDAKASSDSDAIVNPGRKRQKINGEGTKKQKKSDPTQRHGQKAGLEAEDDIPDVDQNEDEGDDVEEAPQDSDFSESDEEGDDYNAEQYFDDGEGDDFDDGGGGEDGSYD